MPIQANNYQVSYYVETAYNTAPDPIQLIEIPAEDVSTSHEVVTNTSTELSPSRLRRRQFAGRVGGSINFTLKYRHGVFNNLLESAARNAVSGTQLTFGGKTQKSLAFQVYHADADFYAVYTGADCTSATITQDAESGTLMIAFSFLTQEPTYSGSTLDATPTEFADTVEVMNQFGPNGMNMTGGPVGSPSYSESEEVMAWSLTLNNNLSAVTASRSSGAVDMVPGDFDIELTTTNYFTNSTILGAWDNSPSNVAWRLQCSARDDDAETLGIDLPNMVRSGDGQPNYTDVPATIEAPWIGQFAPGPVSSTKVGGCVFELDSTTPFAPD